MGLGVRPEAASRVVLRRSGAGWRRHRADRHAGQAVLPPGHPGRTCWHPQDGVRSWPGLALQPFVGPHCHINSMGGYAIARYPAEPTSLVSRVLAGDPAAERELYDAHVDRVYRLAYRMTGDSNQAEEYTQEAFIRVYDKLGSFRGEAALSTWITSVALSVVLNGMRSARRRRDREHDLEQADRIITVERRADPDLKERLRAAINELPEGYRTVFLMHDVEGFTHQEIADSLGVQEGTSKANLSRARARLRVALADFAGAWE